MTGKEVETVATLLKRVRERAEIVTKAVTHVTGYQCLGCERVYDGPPPCSQCGDHRSVVLGSVYPGYAIDIAEGMKSLAAAVEMCSIELADLRRRLDTHAHYEEGRGP